MSTIDSQDVEQFESIADQWWDTNGKFKPLHDFNPIRIEYIKNKLQQYKNISLDSTKCLKGLDLLDIGCGGGILSVPMANLGANVLGVDAGNKNIEAANTYVKHNNISNIEFIHNTVESLPSEHKFDVILAMEVIEHVKDIDLFLSSICKLLKPNGVLFLSTINRTIKSYAKAIIGAEYILQLLPKGTHDWSKFLKPSEINNILSQHSTTLCELDGLNFNPFNNEWSLTQDCSVNYIMAVQKSG